VSETPITVENISTLEESKIRFTEIIQSIKKQGYYKDFSVLLKVITQKKESDLVVSLLTEDSSRKEAKTYLEDLFND
jgi:ribosomal protein S8